MDWLYYSDINASANDIEKILLRKHSVLTRIHRFEDLYSKLEQNQQSVLFIKTFSNYDIYKQCQEVSVRYPNVYIIIIVPETLENIKRAIDGGAADLLRSSSEEEEIIEVIKQAEKYIKCSW